MEARILMVKCTNIYEYSYIVLNDQDRADYQKQMTDLDSYLIDRVEDDNFRCTLKFKINLQFKIFQFISQEYSEIIKRGKLAYSHFVFARLLKLNKIDEAWQFINNNCDYMDQFIEDCVEAKLVDVNQDLGDIGRKMGNTQNLDERIDLLQQSIDLTKVLKMLERFNK